MSNSKYFIATICCSTRFREDIIRIYNELTERGHIVLADLTEHDKQEQFDKPMVDEMHLEKIKMADIVYIVTKDGCMGKSVRIENEFAKRLGKTIHYIDL